MVGDRVPSYGLRNRNNITTIFSRTELFRNSFFPRTTSMWNNLDPSIRNSTSYHSFKSKLSSTVQKPNKLFYLGDRKLNIYHSRLRMNCSSLNEHLFNNHVTPSPECACGAPSESTLHYFFQCPLHILPRFALLNYITQYCQPNLDILLFGNVELSIEDNTAIFSAVQIFIDQTGRF